MCTQTNTWQSELNEISELNKTPVESGCHGDMLLSSPVTASAFKPSFYLGLFKTVIKFSKEKFVSQFLIIFLLLFVLSIFWQEHFCYD